MQCNYVTATFPYMICLFHQRRGFSWVQVLTRPCSPGSPFNISNFFLSFFPSPTFWFFVEKR